MDAHYEFRFRPERCLKCYACDIACRQWKGIPAGGVHLRRVTEVTTGLFPDVKRSFLSSSCRQCDDPACAAACSEGAITKREEDGVVVVDYAKCTGCRLCREACPFSVPEFDADGTMLKCDMCLDRLNQGKAPICADACPTQALRWGPLSVRSES